MARQLKPGQVRTGSLYEITASYALTASYSRPSSFIINGAVTGSVETGSAAFLITSASLRLFEIQSSGILVLATQSQELTGSAPYGGIYFTSASFYVGLD